MATNVTTITTKTLKLRDGRTLGYSEYGDPQGMPVIICQGTPGSRMVYHPDGELPRRLGLRLLTPDRPGFGLSTYRRGLTLRTYADDMRQLADALGFAQVAVVGISGGGPCALVCGYALPEHVRRIVLVAAMGPIADLALQAVMREAGNRAKLKEVKLAQRLPHWAITLLAMPDARKVRKDPEQAASAGPPDMPEVDRAAQANPAFRRMMIAAVPEIYRQGASGAAAEFKLIASPWGFDLGDVRVPVHLWQGELDRNVPPAIARYMAERLPIRTATYLPDDAHLSLYLNHWSEILADLNG